jgi:polygalacturonase
MINPIKSGILFLLILLINVFSSNAKIIPHQAHGIPVSPDFQVWVNNNEVFTGQAGNNSWSYSFCTFDFDEPVNIRVKAKRAIKWLEILPSILKTEHRTIDDFTFEFKLEQPEDLTFFLNNDKKNVLHILTNYPEQERPKPDDKNVLYYKGGQTYEIGVLDLKDNQTLYLESGAKLKGMVRINDVKNVKIMGRGMIDGTDNKTKCGGPDCNDPWRLIYMNNSENIKIEGITLFNSLKWTIHPYNCRMLHIDSINILNWNYGSDGIDVSACQHVKIRNSFFRANDDCVALKSLSLSPDAYFPNPRIKNPNLEDILVEGCTVWNMPYGNPFEIGFELRCEKVKDIVFKDCDVIMQDDRGAVFTIHNSDNAVVENVLYEDIRVENADLCTNSKLIDLAILFSVWSYDRFTDADSIAKFRYSDSWDNLLPVLPGKEKFHASNRGQIRNIKFKNIQILDGGLPYSVIQGFDEDHIVEDK